MKNIKKMKKILFAIAFVMVMVLGASAQSDGWFKASGDDYSQRAGTGQDIALPGSHGLTDDQTGAVPVGSGILVLTAMGAGYAIARRKRK